MSIQIVILAAGQGKRMHSSLPKVLHCLAGKPLLAHVLETALQIKPATQPPIIIYGHQGAVLQQAFARYSVRWAQQKQQLGTGHALLQALPDIAVDDQVLVLSGDVPLISARTLQQLIDTTPKQALGMLTTQLTEPGNYGRIKRNQQNKIIDIIEEKDATPAELAITEINPGIYLVPAKYLNHWLPKLENNNKQQEYYLTDIIACAVQENMTIHTLTVMPPEEVIGVNDREQLAELERFYQRQLAESLMRHGVTICDPARLDIRGDIHIGRDVIIDVNVIFEGRVIIGDDCVIGANTVLRNSELANKVIVRENCLIDGAEIAADCVIGPFARIRPGSLLAPGVHIGNFVEIKNSEIGQATKINHLSYVGDSEIGKQVNIGAGTITCNYDGVNKHRTKIGDFVQVGSNSTLVAPIIIHDYVYVAAATTLRNDVPAGVLAYNKREEHTRAGWTEQKKQQQASNKETK